MLKGEKREKSTHAVEIHKSGLYTLLSRRNDVEAHTFLVIISTGEKQNPFFHLSRARPSRICASPL
jgi:hypothetical protein